LLVDEYQARCANSPEGMRSLCPCNRARLQSCRKGRKTKSGFSPAGESHSSHHGPLRLRVPRQLGYKSLKFLTHITVTDDIKKFGSGKGSVDPDYGYSWYAGI